MNARTGSIALIALLLAAPAAAGALHGTLRLKAGARGGAEAGASQRRVTDAVVYVEKVPEAVERRFTRPRGFLFFRKARAPEVLNVVQRSRFEPRVAAIPAGTRVAFVNLDRYYHNVFSVSSSRRFDLGKTAPGARDTVLFERPGVVNLHCDVHPEEHGYLVVTPNHVVARPDSLGRWRLPKLPPGPYTVRVFHPFRGELSRDVVLPASGDLAVDLVQ